jgi:hypothetical protein
MGEAGHHRTMPRLYQLDPGPIARLGGRPDRILNLGRLIAV